MADAVCGLILFYSLVFGARRGFFKEVVQFVALIAAVLIARGARVPVGGSISAKTGVPVMAAEVVAVVVVWVVAFVAVAVVGRLLLKKLRGDGIDDELDEGAEAIADAIGGDTYKGPVTLLTDPIATKTGVYYWLDKVLGAGLGFAKGIVTVIVLFSLVLYADRARGWESSFAKSVEGSGSASVFSNHLDPYLRSFPEYRILTSLRAMKGIAEEVRAEPRRFLAFARHRELEGLKNHPRIAELAQEADVKAAWEARDLKALLGDPRVRGLLQDAALRERIAEVNWDRVLEDVKAHQPSAEGDLEAIRELSGQGDAPPEAPEAPAVAPGDDPAGP